MLLNRRPDVERFLANPDKAVRAALIYGRDLGVVRERGQELAAKVAERPDDPFDVALVTDADLDDDPGRLVDELMALFADGRAAPGAPAALQRARRRRTGWRPRRSSGMRPASFNPDAFFLIEAGKLGPQLGPAQGRREGRPPRSPSPATRTSSAISPASPARRWPRTRLALTSDALDLFVRRLPHERGVARREIERLALYLGPGSGATGTADDLTDFLGVEPEASLADAAQDAFGGRLGGGPGRPCAAPRRRARAARRRCAP